MTHWMPCERVAQGAGAGVVEHLDVVDAGVRRDAGRVGRRAVVPRACRRRSRRRACRGRTGPASGWRRWRSPLRSAASSALPGASEVEPLAPGDPVGRAGIAQVDVAPHARCAAAIEEGVDAPSSRPSRAPRCRCRCHRAAAELLLMLPVRTLLGQRSGDRFERARGAASDAVRRHARHVAALGEREHIGRRAPARSARARPDGRRGSIRRSRSTAARRSVIAGSVELLTTIACTWRTPLRSRIQLAFDLPVSARPVARSRAIFAWGGSVGACALAIVEAHGPRIRASAIRPHDRMRRSPSPSSRTMSGAIGFMAVPRRQSVAPREPMRTRG